MKINKKFAGFVVGIFANILLFAAAANAGISSDFSDGLARMNEFFASNQYQAYAQTIDFIFFSLLFISVYMIGARYGLKQIGKPEKVFVVVLGVLSAFLLVSAGFSVALLVPYVQWLLYFLLFTAIWLVLKGMKSKFLRFLIALLLAFLIIVLMSGSFEIPEVEIQF